MTRTVSALIAICAYALSPGISAQASEPDSPFFEWFTGCWQSLDGATREVWSQREGDHLFGYSVVLDPHQEIYPAKHVVFFELMRIDLLGGDDHAASFLAYPSGEGPTRFNRVHFGERHVTYENPDTDFPQRIRYWRDGEDLKAEISTLDRKQTHSFAYVPCAAD